MIALPCEIVAISILYKMEIDKDILSRGRDIIWLMTMLGILIL